MTPRVGGRRASKFCVHRIKSYASRRVSKANSTYDFMILTENAQGCIFSVDGRATFGHFPLPFGGLATATGNTLTTKDR
jgi:hypothetical protein